MTGVEWNVDRARMFSRFAHWGQVDKAGKDYFTWHVEDVWVRTRLAGLGEDAEIVALLHDVPEDWPGRHLMMFNALASLDLPRHLFMAVEAITHHPRERRSEYYDRVLQNPLALSVKAHDIASNTDPQRLALLDPDEMDRLVKKYDEALRYLHLL